jgi:hypothetical protein
VAKFGKDPIYRTKVIMWKRHDSPVEGVITIIPFHNLYRRAYFVMHTFLVNLEPISRGQLFNLEPISRGQLFNLEPINRRQLFNLEPISREQLFNLEPISRGQVW